MAIAADEPLRPRRASHGLRARLLRLAASPRFQRWASGVPIVRSIARREGDALFDIVQGFVASQVLYALVSLNVLHRLMDAPMTAAQAAHGTSIAPDRMARLLNAATALRLLRRRGALYAPTTRGAALLGVPGLEQMIRHHDVLYRDLADPLAFLRGETSPELASFWPYVFGAGGATDPDVTATYSDLMAQSQGLVAHDTLRTVSLKGVARMADVGGGSGAFAEAAVAATPGLTVTLYDLPAVMDAAETRLRGSVHRDRITLARGSFRDDPLPEGMEAISLIRVLYDHKDETVLELLRKVHAALPPNGRLVISEPMAGSADPEPAGDVYFAFYCMAMGTGTVRSQSQIADLLRRSGFTSIETPQSRRPFVTSVVTAIRGEQDRI